jgi:hypothetical protein
MSRTALCCPRRDCRTVLGYVRPSGNLVLLPGTERDDEREPGAWWLRCPVCGDERRYELRRTAWLKARAA